MPAISDVYVDIGARTTALGRGLEKAKAMLKSFGSQKESSSGGGGGLMGAGMMGAGMAAGAAAMTLAANAMASVSSAIAESSRRGADLNETLSKTGVLMGDATADAVKFASELQNSGQGQMKDILESITGSAMAMKGMGMETGKAIDMAKQLEARVGDIASQDNIDPAKIREDLQSAFAGEFQIMRKYKVFLDAETLKKSGLPMGEAIAQGILQQTQRAKGDFENTRLSTSNMQRTNSNSVDTMMAQFGQAIQPVTQALAYLKSVVLAALGAMNPEGFTGVIDKMRNTIIEMSAGIAIAVVGLANGLMTVAKFFLNAVSVVGGFIGDMLIGFGGFSGVFGRMGLELAYRLAQGIDLLIQPFRWIAKQMGISLGEGMTSLVESLGQQREAMDQKAGENIATARAKSEADKAAMAKALQQNSPPVKGAVDETTGKSMPTANTPSPQRTSFSALLNNATKAEKTLAVMEKIEGNTRPGGGAPGAATVTTKKPGPPTPSYEEMKRTGNWLASGF